MADKPKVTDVEVAVAAPLLIEIVPELQDPPPLLLLDDDEDDEEDDEEDDDEDEELELSGKASK